MKETVKELEQFIVQNLKSTNLLKNEIERKENEKDDLLKYVSMDIIDIIDSFENIEEWIIDKEYLEIDEVKKTTNRYISIHKRLLRLLQNHGITKIEFPDNRLIVGLCEVVETEANSQRENDEILSVIRTGYIRGSEIIRPAQIIVVKN